MSMKALLWAFETPVGDLKAKLVLVALADQANDEGQCWPSIATIGRRCEMSRSSIFRAIAYLEEFKILKKDNRLAPSGGKTSSIFTLSLEEGGRCQPDTGGRCQPDTRRCQPDTGEVSLQTHHKPSLEPSLNLEVPAQSASDGSPTPVDEPPKARLFREGKTILVSLGISESRSGSIIGGWLKKLPDPEGILAALVYARDQAVIEPVGYVTRLLASTKMDNGGRKSFADLAFGEGRKKRTFADIAFDRK